MLKLAHSVILAAGWRRRCIAFFSGAAGALALAPIGLWPAFVIPMSVSVWLLDGAAGEAVPGQPGKRTRNGWSSLLLAMDSGWWIGFGYFLAGLWWLGQAFLVEADRFAWALPLGVVGLPALLACYTATGFGLARLLWTPGAARILALALGLSASEWLRGHLFSGFPWNDFGMVLGTNLYLGQFASLAGLYGLTLLAVALFAAPACLVDRRPSATAVLAASIMALAGLAAFGAARLALGEAGTVKGVRLRIMQPNVQQDLKFRAARKDELIGQYLALSDRATSPQNTGLGDVTHLIWPESAFPFILSSDAQALARIGSALPAGAILITGAARLGPAKAGKRAPVFNSIQVVASGGTILRSYDKVHLVPFGEYMPFADLLRSVGLQQFTLSSFDAGDRRQLLSVPGLPPVMPLICYEAIFSGEVRPDGENAADKRPGLFLNVTNDSWFGSTPGPYQHLAQARLRSIEEGIPMVRSGDTGISAIIDPFGRLIESLPLGSEGVLDGALPSVAEPTLFSRFGMLTWLTIWIVALISYSLARLGV